MPFYNTFLPLKPKSKTLRIHLIAIGGAAMHNIALELKARGHNVSGSDDEIYEPSLSRLKAAGILPESFGWHPPLITSDIDFIILGMHARIDNPELAKAKELGIPVYSYPEFIFNHSKDKTRVVIAGSHGKTTTTAMILHVLKKKEMDFDYLVGAQLEGFERMVKLSDAPIMVIEGDEYLSSPIDRVPKIHHYKPHIAVITGIAWDHMNVFPTFDNYKEQFFIFIQTIVNGGHLIYYKPDEVLGEIVAKSDFPKPIPYDSLIVDEDKRVLIDGDAYAISTIGNHNLRNMNAAMLVCASLGIDHHEFMKAIEDFTGASKRLQQLSATDKRVIFLDFAHAPSKVKATTDAFKDWYGSKKLLAVVELHTFSSLNKSFIPQYKDTLNLADKAIVFFNEHTLKMKKMPPLEISFLMHSFGHADMEVFTNETRLRDRILDDEFADYNILLMTSGNFNKMDLKF